MVDSGPRVTHLPDTKPMVLTNTEDTSGPYQFCDCMIQNVKVRFLFRIRKRIQSSSTISPLKSHVIFPSQCVYNFITSPDFIVGRIMRTSLKKKKHFRYK